MHAELHCSSAQAPRPVPPAIIWIVSGWVQLSDGEMVMRTQRRHYSRVNSLSLSVAHSGSLSDPLPLALCHEQNRQ